ncbi:MAG: hypothetical protein ACOCUD_01695 [Bacillota bacterium]
MDKKLMLLMFGIILLSLVSVTAYTPHKQNTGLNVSFTSPESDNCSITNINNPDGTINPINLEMNADGESYWYYLSGGNFSQLGETTINLYCCDSDATPICVDGSIIRDVNSSGQKIDEGGVWFYIISILGIFIMAGFFLFLSGQFKGDKGALSGTPEAKGNPAIRFGLISLSMVLCLIGVIYSYIALTEVLGGFERIIDSYYIFFYILLSIFFIFFIFVLIGTTFRAIESIRSNKGFKPKFSSGGQRRW